MDENVAKAREIIEELEYTLEHLSFNSIYQRIRELHSLLKGQ